MKISGTLRSIKYFTEFIPFKINFFIYCVVLFGSFKIIHSYKGDTNSFIALTILMAKIALIFSVIVVFFSFMSTLISSLFFLQNRNTNRDTAVQIEMNANEQEQDVLRIITKIPQAIKPMLGFVSVKLFYDKKLSTEKYLLTGRIKKQFIPFNSGLMGDNQLMLPHIKEYYFSHALVYFEDMLKFFAFSIPARVNHTVMNMPHSILYNPSDFSPKKTEEEKIRIDQLRKVEGEYLNYKKFEDSDDVRRIVWKIFAKNKELVVRTPEIMDPFASHLYMYASFYNSFSYELYDEYCNTMLNYFKNCVWTIYDTLANNTAAHTDREYKIKYISDQKIEAHESAKDKTRYTITLSSWHQDAPLTDYYKPKNASILCLHSFSKLEDIENVIRNYESGTTLFFVQLSKVFKSHYLFNWLMRIFFKAPEDALSNLKSKWAIHPMKFKVIHNEQKIMELLKKQDINFEVL